MRGPRTKRLEIRLTPELFERIREKSGALRIPISEYVRACVLTVVLRREKRPRG